MCKCKRSLDSHSIKDLFIASYTDTGPTWQSTRIFQPPLPNNRAHGPQCLMRGAILLAKANFGDLFGSSNPSVSLHHSLFSQSTNRELGAFGVSGGRVGRIVRLPGSDPGPDLAQTWHRPSWRRPASSKGPDFGVSWNFLEHLGYVKKLRRTLMGDVLVTFSSSKVFVFGPLKSHSFGVTSLAGTTAPGFGRVGGAVFGRDLQNALK